MGIVKYSSFIFYRLYICDAFFTVLHNYFFNYGWYLAFFNKLCAINVGCYERFTEDIYPSEVGVLPPLECELKLYLIHLDLKKYIRGFM